MKSFYEMYCETHDPAPEILKATRNSRVPSDLTIPPLVPRSFSIPNRLRFQFVTDGTMRGYRGELTTIPAELQKNP
jgi:hypothetical protein